MTNPIPKGAEGIICHLVVNDCAKAMDFYQKAFGAEEIMRMPGPDGRIMHAEMKLGDQLLYLADDFPEFTGGRSRAPASLGGTPITIHRYVTDCDAAIKKAEGAGATIAMPAQDMFWGDRYGTIVDPFGHMWSFATHVRDMTPEEMDEAAKKAFG